MTLIEQDTKQDKASFDGQTLKALFHYDWPSPHSREIEWRVTDPLAQDCIYWCAFDGQCFGIAEITKGRSCIASTESAWRLAVGASRVNVGRDYVIWKYKQATAGAWKAWAKKWGKRTSPMQEGQ